MRNQLKACGGLQPGSMSKLINNGPRGYPMRFSALTAQPVPWKNGGGITRELAVHKENGQIVWRLSLAEIERSGPFSAFPGRARIHCIVEGAGHTLADGHIRLEARPLTPVFFDGGLALDCRLRDGVCKAFNVIYDPNRVTPKAEILSGGTLRDCEGIQAFFVVSGSLEMHGKGRFLPGEGVTAKGAATGEVSDGGAVIQVQFSTV
ncbi:HutD/Ves family protein [Leisingera sp. ANG-M6]|uniref:HutD/Ves family protein n=1 Tax=Leisingera sp. ANG-M6 TaxID=1577900 RepID=UPI001F4C88FF|nr:HutD family protein [Leisingera sp. ANG-M6]